MLLTKGKDRLLGVIIYSNMGDMVYVPKETTYQFPGGRSKCMLGRQKSQLSELISAPMYQNGVQ